MTTNLTICNKTSAITFTLNFNIINIILFKLYNSQKREKRLKKEKTFILL